MTAFKVENHFAEFHNISKHLYMKNTENALGAYFKDA